MTFDPACREFGDLDWNEFLELDRQGDFSLRENMKVWASPDARADFRQLLWKASKTDSDITRVGFFDEKLEELQHLHPEWFVETSPDPDELPTEPDKMDLLRSEIRQLVDTMRERRHAVAIGAGFFVIGIVIGHWT